MLVKKTKAAEEETTRDEWLYH